MCFARGGMQQQTIAGMSILFWPVWPAECCQADKCLPHFPRLAAAPPDQVNMAWTLEQGSGTTT